MRKVEISLKNTSIKILYGNITKIKVDAVVNPLNNKLEICDALAKLIRKKLVKEIQKKCQKISSLKTGESVITSSGKLKCCKYMIHTVVTDTNFKTNQEYIRSAINTALKVADENKITSISFPALCFGTGEFPYKDLAKIMAEEITKYIIENKDTNIKEIIFVVKQKKVFKTFSEVISEHVGYINRKIGVYPIPTVDIIINVKIKHKSGIVLVQRKNPPYGWALPGGFVEYNESLENAALREAKEETGLEVKNLKQFHTYSQPGRDPRFHTISTVFVADAEELPKAGSDAKRVVVATKEEILANKYQLVFDHKKILLDYFSSRYN